MTLYYFTEEKVLINEDGKIVDPQDYHISGKTLEDVFKNTEDEIIFIRDSETRYEIHKMKGSIKEIISEFSDTALDKILDVTNFDWGE